MLRGAFISALYGIFTVLDILSILGIIVENTKESVVKCNALVPKVDRHY